MRFRLFVPLFVAATFLPAVTACEGGEGEGEEGEGEEAELDDLVDAFVKFFDECKPFGDIEKYEPILAAGFTGQFQRASVEASLQRSVDNPALTLNKQEVAACIAEFDSCSASVFGGADSACNRIFDGNRENGDGCASSQECVDGLICNGTSDGESCGTCGAPPGDGEVCESECADGLVCVGDDEGNDPVCQTPLAIGAVCDEFNDACGEDAFCDDEQDPTVCTANSATAAPKEAGDACNEEDGCGSINTGLACVNAVCVEMGVAQPGQACEPDQQEPAVWCINQLSGTNVCVVGANPDEGVCTAVNGVGGDCVQGRCTDDAVCNANNECVAPPGVGDECIDFSCAEGLICNEDEDPAICAAPPANGQPCIGFQCGEDSTCNNDDVCEALPGEGEACPDFDCAGDLDCNDDNICVDFTEELVCAE